MDVPYADPSLMTYDQVWADFCAGRMSTVVLLRLMRDDAVFARWAMIRAKARRGSSLTSIDLEQAQADHCQA